MHRKVFHHVEVCSHLVRQTCIQHVQGHQRSHPKSCSRSYSRASKVAISRMNASMHCKIIHDIKVCPHFVRQTCIQHVQGHTQGQPKTHIQGHPRLLISAVFHHIEACPHLVQDLHATCSRSFKVTSKVINGRTDACLNTRIFHHSEVSSPDRPVCSTLPTTELKKTFS